MAVAEYQTSGRGREERHWWAPPRTCLLLSILFRPSFPLPAIQTHQLTMLCSLAACDAITAHTGLVPNLKWPNDLLLEGKKIGGVLTESAFVGGRLEHAVVGMGINVNLRFDARLWAAHPQELSLLQGQATSLLLHLGHPVDRTILLQALLERADFRYRHLQEGGRFHEEWSRRLAKLGQRVRVEMGTERVEGVAEGVDANGSLVLRLADGSLRRILAGDVTQLRPL